MQETSVYRFIPGIGFQNINIKKLNDNFEALSRDALVFNIVEENTISAGSKGFVYLPFSAKITGWVVGTYTSASLTVDVRKCTGQNYPAATSIAGNSKIVVTDSAFAECSVLTGWDSFIPCGSWIEFFVESSSGTNRADIILKVNR